MTENQVEFVLHLMIGRGLVRGMMHSKFEVMNKVTGGKE